MRRPAAYLAAGLLAAAAPQPDPPDPAPWQEGGWPGIPRARLAVGADGAISVSSQGQGGFVWRAERRAAECLSWRWRVDEGPPPTRLDRRGGDDRALAITIGFADWPPGAGPLHRARHAAAEAGGGRALPRAALAFVWGGTGAEPRGFESPYMGGLGRVFVLRPADAPRGTWVEERIDLAAAWREAFGGSPPGIAKIAVAVDSDDTRSRVEARVEAIRFGPCPRRS